MGFSIILAISVIMGTVGVLGMSSLLRSGIHMYENLVANLKYVNAAGTAFDMMRIENRNVIINSLYDDKKGAIDRYNKFNKYSAEFINYMDMSKSIATTSEMLNFHEQILNLLTDKYLPLAHKNIEISIDDIPDHNNRLYINAENTYLTTITAEIENMMSGLIELNSALARQSNINNIRTTQIFITLQGLLLITAVIIAVSIALYIIRSIAIPINEYVLVLKQVAQGDFTAQIKGSYEGDFKIIKDTINDTTAKISDYLNEKINIEHEARERAELESHYKSVFLANMSHEIRTPMNAILGIAEIQLQNDTLSSESQKALSQILESGDLLMNTINDILDFSKIENGKLELINVEYDIKSLIDTTVQLNCLRYESKPLQFNVKVDENTPLELFGDELRIKQILNNILSNAFKYTDEGTIELSVSAICNDDNVKLTFCVSDTGQGMTETELEKLFNDFTRFNINENRTIAGTGLGMSITKRLVDLMNGEISVQSEQGKGTVFTVSLPQKRIGSAVFGSGSPQIEEPDKHQEPSFNSWHPANSNSSGGSVVARKKRLKRGNKLNGSVLVVDDVESNLFVAKGMLLPYGLNIDTATSGFEAIEKIQNGSVYDIIFMDHMMPKMNGIETVKKLRDIGYKHCIIAFTANALVGQSQVYLQNGFNGFITKPIDSRELNQLLTEHFKHKKESKIENINYPPIENNNDDSYQNNIKKFFILDAEKAINTLNDINISNISNDDLELYIVTTHGIKTALANVDEKELSELAIKLEQAARKQDMAIISKETELFVNALRSLTEKLKTAVQEKNDSASSENTSEDKAYLTNKLQQIKEACVALDKKKAKALLIDLKQKNWPENINTTLDDIAVFLLHSEFEKIEVSIDSLLAVK